LGDSMTELPIFPLPPENPPAPSVVVLGRFQPFHRGHAYMIEFADKWRLENMPNASLVIAIGSSNRPESLRNPWTHLERSDMINEWLAESSLEDTPIFAPIPDIEDPPNWVHHAEMYHGGPGVFLSSDRPSLDLYGDCGWPTFEIPMEERNRLEGWRVRETARMMSTIADEGAITEVLGVSVPLSVIDYLVRNDALKRLAFLGEGGEPVG